MFQRPEKSQTDSAEALPQKDEQQEDAVRVDNPRGATTAKQAPSQSMTSGIPTSSPRSEQATSAGNLPATPETDVDTAATAKHLTETAIEPVIQLEFNVPKIEGKGEDADPVMIWQAPCGVLSVFDGMGGAGSTVYQRRGQSYTGAYIASRIAADEIRSCFRPSFPLPTFPLSSAVTEELQQQLKDALRREASQLEVGAEPTRIKSKLIKRLPTTMAMLLVKQEKAHAVCQSLWAGDSRCYGLSAEIGLQQLTTDDLKSGGDALHNLKDDSPMSNCLNADEEFELRSQTQTLPLPVILLAATDGCFGYLFSPAHFEFLLIDTLMTATNVVAWRDLITARLQSFAGDDCSMCLLALGWPTYEALQTAFSKRHQMLNHQFIEPLDVLSAEISKDTATLRQIESRKTEAEKRREELRGKLWARYKETHDQLLKPSPPSEEAKAGEPK